MDMWYYLMIPFSMLLKLFYSIFNSYGLAIILFSLVIKIILFPASLKGKRSMIQMNVMQERVNKIQKQYANNKTLANQKVEELYTKEGVNPMGGCLWSLVPLFILFPIYAVVRRPLKYWLGLTDALIKTVTEAATAAGVSLGTRAAYPEITIISSFYKDGGLLERVKAAVPDAADKLYGVNFNFLGIDLSATPTLKFWENGLSWGSIGLFLIPVLVVVTSFLSSQIMMKTNNQVSKTEASQSNSKMMQWMSPLMMAYFSFIMPAAMGIYIMANSIFAVAQEIICAKMLEEDYRKAAEAAKQREIDEKEEEKRIRRERAERHAREAEEAKKNKGKKKEKAPQDEDKLSPEQKSASREGMRAYARGRAYDPNRFGGVTPYHDGESTIPPGLYGAEAPQLPAESEENTQS